MAVISMDANDQGANRRPAFRLRNVESSLVETEQPKTPSPLGYHLLRVMKEGGYYKVAPFARAAGIAGSTMHRVIYGDSGRPDVDTLLQIARALAGRPSGGDASDAEKAAYERTVEDIHQRLLTEAGYRVGAEVSTRTYDPLALEIDDLLGIGSTLPETDRDLLRTMIDRLIEPYRRRGRRRAG